LSEQQPGYVFNLDSQTDRNCIIVCEGPLDAISIDAVSIMGAEINSQQRYIIERLKKRIILVPDRDDAGKKLVDEAVKYNWSVSMPSWDLGIKDINDAVRTYGKLVTLLMIKQAEITNDVKIKLIAREWFKC
jgi:DNA primase